MITDTALISFLMLSKFRKGTTRATLIESFSWLKGEVAARDFTVCGGSDSTDAHLVPFDQQVDATLALISHLIVASPQRDEIKTFTSLEALIELLFYSNQLLHVFWGEALALTAALSTLEPKQLADLHQPVFASRDAVQTRFEEVPPLTPFG